MNHLLSLRSSVSFKRDNIVYISQNEMLYTDTVRNNIILDREVSKEEFLKICKITCVDDIVNNKLLSYDYVLEENGANLSGGQRQRIVLARTLLKNSKSFASRSSSSCETVSVTRMGASFFRL